MSKKVGRPPGFKHSDEHKKLISQKLKGKIVSEETRIKLGLKSKGRRHTKESIEKNRIAHLGNKNGRWIEDRNNLKKGRGKQTSSYTEWRKNVYTRDRHECKLKNDECKGRIEAHHIYNWVDFPELRYNVNNGITLCHFHHPIKWSEEDRLIPLFLKII